MSTQNLAITFYRSGYLMTQYTRDNLYAIYYFTRPGRSKKHPQYEVIKIINPSSGNESYPSAQEFPLNGYLAINQFDAIQHYNIWRRQGHNNSARATAPAQPALVGNTATGMISWKWAGKLNHYKVINPGGGWLVEQSADGVTWTTNSTVPAVTRSISVGSPGLNWRVTGKFSNGSTTGTSNSVKQ